MFDILASHEIVMIHAGLSEPLSDRYEFPIGPNGPIGPIVQFYFLRLTKVYITSSLIFFTLKYKDLFPWDEADR